MRILEFLGITKNKSSKHELSEVKLVDKDEKLMKTDNFSSNIITKSELEIVKRKSTRFYVTQSDYEQLISKPNSKLIITVSPNKNKHVKGIYEIPNLVAIKFIESKQNTHNWENHKNFKQDSIPAGLEIYFKKN